MTIAEALMTALTSYDDEYLEAERALMPVAADAARLLAADRSADPATAVLERVLRDAAEGLAGAFAALDPFVDSLEEEVRGTPVLQPVPESVARILDHRHKSALVPFAAWRLIHQPGLKEWRAMALLLYCAHHPEAVPPAALARYVSTTGNPRLLGIAKDLLRSMEGGFDALVAEARWLAQA